MSTINDYALQSLTFSECEMFNGGGHPDGWDCWLIAAALEFQSGFLDTFSSAIDDGYKSMRNL